MRSFDLILRAPALGGSLYAQTHPSSQQDQAPLDSEDV